MNLASLSAAASDIPLIPLVAAERIRYRPLRVLGMTLGWLWLLGPGLALWLIFEWALGTFEVLRAPLQGPVPRHGSKGARVMAAAETEGAARAAVFDRNLRSK